MSCGWMMAAMTRRRPPQSTQVVPYPRAPSLDASRQFTLSISNGRLSRSSQVSRWDVAGGGGGESACGVFWCGDGLELVAFVGLTGVGSVEGEAVAGYGQDAMLRGSGGRLIEAVVAGQVDVGLIDGSVCQTRASRFRGLRL